MRVKMDFRMSGYFNRDFTPQELAEFEAGYGGLNLFIKNEIHKFQKTMFQEIDNYRLDISVEKQEDQDEIPGDDL